MNLFYQALEKHRDKTFILQGEKKWSYGDFLEEVDRYSHQDQLKDADQKYFLQYVSDWDFLLKLLALWKLKKTPVLLPPHQLDTSALSLKDNGENDDALIIPTSGSSGRPEYRYFTEEALYYSALGSVEFYQMTEGDLYALTLPPYHVGGLMIILRSILAGGKIQLKTQHWSELTQRPFQFISLVPKQLQDLLNDPISLNFAKESKGILLGGATTPPSLFNRGIQNGLPLSLSYGLTESASQLMATKPGDSLYHLGEILPHRQMKINEDQSILIGGKTLCKGLVDENGFMETKDRALLNENNQIIGIERTDDIIISGGKNISPLELKNLFLAQFQESGVKDCEVFKCYHPQWGETPLLAYESSEKIDEELFNQCPGWKRPQFFHHAPSFPRKGIKVDRLLLQREVILHYLKNQLHIPYLYRKYSHQEGVHPLIVFFHGFMGKAEDEFFQDLPADIISFDLHGLQFHPGYLMSILLPITQLFYGYSMGGRLLLSHLGQLKNSHNKPFFVVESSHLGLKDEEEKTQRLEHDQKLADKISNLKSKEDYRLFLDAWYDSPVFQGIKTNTGYDQFIEQKVDNFTLKKAGLWSKDLIKFSLAHQEFIEPDGLSPELIERIFFIVGNQDHKFLELYQKLLLDGAKKQLHIIESASHNCHFQNPQKVKELLRKILEKPHI